MKHTIDRKEFRKSIKNLFEREGNYIKARRTWLKTVDQNTTQLPPPFPFAIGHFMNELVIIIQKHNLRLDSDFVSMMLSFGIMEGVSNLIEPNTDIIGRSIPYFDKYDGFQLMSDKINRMGGLDYLLRVSGF